MLVALHPVGGQGLQVEVGWGSGCRAMLVALHPVGGQGLRVEVGWGSGCRAMLVDPRPIAVAMAGLCHEPE